MVLVNNNSCSITCDLRRIENQLLSNSVSIIILPLPSVMK